MTPEQAYLAALQQEYANTIASLAGRAANLAGRVAQLETELAAAQAQLNKKKKPSDRSVE